jgi:hypothetical protein
VHAPLYFYRQQNYPVIVAGSRPNRAVTAS